MRLSSSIVLVLLPACFAARPIAETARAAETSSPRAFNEDVEANAARLFAQGQDTFRWDSLGSEAFWGDQLKMHEVFIGRGIGRRGLSPRRLLQLGLKIDVGAVPTVLATSLREGAGAGLDDPRNTVELLRAGAVVGVVAVQDRFDRITAIGVSCALCHSTVDDVVSPGVGRRLDGWPNRDLDVGALLSMAPVTAPLEDLFHDDAATVRQRLQAWGPGRSDAFLGKGGNGLRGDGETAAVLIPAAFGLAGQPLHAGWGSIPCWDAFFINGGTSRDDDDDARSRLPALQFYQLAIPAPRPAIGSFDVASAARGRDVFNGAARCGSCHVPPLFAEPDAALHTGSEIGIDEATSARTPDGLYRTSPLAGLFARGKGGYYHDGRFADLAAVVAHYERALPVRLHDDERDDLIEYLKSL